MKKVRMGIIGFGVQGSTYAGFLRDNKISGMELGAICDIDKEVRKKAEEAHSGINIYEDYIKMIESKDVDAVVTTVPHYLHPVMGIEAILRNMPVICEKPAGVYTKQVKELNECSRQHPEVPFAIMFNQRSNPLYIELKKIMDSGELGELRRTNWIITNWWRPQVYYNQSEWRATWGAEGGGVLVNQSPHQLDLIQWLCGKPKTVYANVQFGCHRDIPVENEVTALLEYENGATGVFITCTHDVLGTDRLEILCDKGKIVVEESNRAIVKVLKESETDMNASYDQEKVRMLAQGKSEGGFYEERVIEFPSTWGNQHIKVFENFADHLLNQTPLMAPGTDGINGVRLANAMLLSGFLNEKVDYEFDDELFVRELNKRIQQEGKYPQITL